MKAIYYAAACCFFLYSCAKDSPENTYPRNLSSNGQLAAYFAANAQVPATMTFDAAQGGTFTTSRGTTVSWMPNAFETQSGQPVTGMVTVECIEVLNKREALFNGGFTTSRGRLLRSGGEVKLTFWQNNQELGFVSDNVVFLAIFAGNDPMCGHGMHEFYADEISEGQDFDQGSTDTIYYSDNPTLTGSPFVYEFGVDHPGWINVDQMMSNGPQTTFIISLPELFDGDNCAVFVSYDGLFSIAQLYHFDEATHAYHSGTYYTLPVGAPVTFLAIGEINGQFYYAQHSCMVTDDLGLSLYPAPVSQATIDQRIAALP